MLATCMQWFSFIYSVIFWLYCTWTEQWTMNVLCVVSITPPTHQVSSSESSSSLGSSSFSSHLKNSFINSSTGLLKVSNHRIVKITGRTPDVIFSRIGVLRSQKTLKQKPKGVTLSRRRTGFLCLFFCAPFVRNSFGPLWQKNP